MVLVPNTDEIQQNTKLESLYRVPEYKYGRYSDYVSKMYS